MDFFVGDLRSYLSERLSESIHVRAVQRFPRGTSRETWFVSFTRDASQTDQTLVFRTDLPSGSFDATSLDQEHFLYERLSHTTVPIARPLWWEDDPRWTTRAFYVREHVAGSWNVPNFLDPDPRHDELRIDISREHMRKLASVHHVDWKGLGLQQRLPAPQTDADCARNYLTTLRQQFERVRIEADPLFLEATEWLLGRAPVAPRICLCKGTNGLGEEIFDGGKIVAMSDWEEASIGDPAADFAFMQNFAPDIMRDGEVVWGMEHALAYYRQISGINVQLASVQYYGLIRALRLLVTAQKAAASSIRSATVRGGWTATEVAHLMRRVLAAAMGWIDPPSGQRMLELNASVEAS